MSKIFTSDELSEQEKKQFIDHKRNTSNIIDKDDLWYYNDNTHITNSMLKLLKTDGPEYLDMYLKGDIKLEGKHFDIGKAFHCAILEQEEFSKRFCHFDDEELVLQIGGGNPRNTKVYKEKKEIFEIENEGKILLNSDEYNDLINMSNKINSNIVAKELLSNTEREIIYSNNILGEKAKCKVDAINHGSYIVDLKSMKDTPNQYNTAKAINIYDYDMQAAWYVDITGVQSFWFIAVKKTNPYTIGIYEASETTLNQGREKYMKLLEDYKHYFKNPKFELDKFCYMGQV